jgi:RimJ/RimL family protein N-acetyltransferase
MSDFKIINAKKSDSKSIAAFLQRNFKIHNLKFDKMYINRSFENGAWFTTKLNEKIVGTVLLSIIRQDNRAELKHLLVEKNFRRRGVGTRLLHTALNYAKRKKLRKITGNATSGNNKIISKLAKLYNFALEGISKDHYRKNEDVYIYSAFLKK